MGHLGPSWSRECQDPVRNKVILTKMVVVTILDHFGPVHFPIVLRRLLRFQIARFYRSFQIAAIAILRVGHL